jgi:DnaJ-class molecular chaperone
MSDECPVCHGLREVTQTCSGQCRGGRIEVTCSTCGGSGLIDDVDTCPRCGGSGTDEENCPKCGGSGSEDVTCPACGGTGLDEPRRGGGRENPIAPGEEGEGTPEDDPEGDQGYEDCPDCDGERRYDLTCGYCHGSGRCAPEDGTEEEECWQCQGVGTVAVSCNACHGSGSVPVSE